MNFVIMKLIKEIRLHSIRTKIFFILVCFISFAGILIALNNHFFYEKEKLNKKLGKLREFEILINKAVYYQNLVFLNDVNANSLYEKEYTFNLVSYTNHYNEALKLIKKFNSKEIEENNSMNMFYGHTLSELKKINYYFNKIISLQKIRGFRDLGMEGRMREFAHYIEKSIRDDGQKTSLLQMRRHEKDYFLRGDKEYAEKLRLESTILLSKFKDGSEIKNSIVNYYTVFDSINFIDNLTGVKTKKGYFNMLNIYTSQLNYSVNNLYKEYKTFHKEALTKLTYLQTFVTVILLMLAFLISIMIATSLTGRIRKLSAFMNKYVENQFKIKSRFEPDMNKDEISDLVHNFKVLEDEITVQFEKYKVKVATRTEEIIAQKNEIEKQNSIIEIKNEELTKQKNVLDFQNHHIIDSLRAAKELQKMFFPGNNKLNEILGDFYLKFEPLDIVSGDFYWIERTKNGIYLAIADCTGHGAHGALMSINGINLLNHAIFDKGLVQPGEILNYLSEKIYKQFSSEEDIKNTIDIALVRIDNSEVHFSGAQRDVLILRDSEIIELSGNRRPLGWIVKNELHQFNTVSMSLEKQDTLILFTDGVTDQFGGLNHKKFKKSNLIDLIKKSSAFSFEELCEIVSESFDSWKNNTNQTDDVTFFAFKYESVKIENEKRPKKVKQLSAKQG
jgi:sigma-B regulation protein RsbU (phosphoserine phosphatase)